MTDFKRVFLYTTPDIGGWYEMEAENEIEARAKIFAQGHLEIGEDLTILDTAKAVTMTLAAVEPTWRPS